MKLESQRTILALKAQLRREQVRSKGLADALVASKRSRDNFSQRYWEMRKQLKDGHIPASKAPACDSKYLASYKAGLAHLTRFIKCFEDGEALYFYLEPGNIVGRPIDNLIVNWRVVKKDDQIFDLEFVEEIKLVV